MRELATVQVISNLQPIPNADKIELATVLGWKVVVKKDEFKVGDYCVYFEIDSILPIRDWSSFLLDTKGNMHRLKTIRLRGQISQGLALPISILPKDLYGVGQDVTELLGVTKWEPVQTVMTGNKAISTMPAIRYSFPKWMPNIVRQSIIKFFPKWGKDKYGIYVGNTFPHFISKTDETRVQVLQALLDKYQGMPFFHTEKLDGSSITVYRYKGIFGVCSRNIDLKEEEGNIFWSTVRRLKIEEKLIEQGLDNISLQGELIGPSIQGNKYNLKTTHIYFFNIFDVTKNEYYSLDDMCSLANTLKIDLVPLIGFSQLTNNIDSLVELATNRSMINPDVQREGIVLRPIFETKEYDICRDKLVASNILKK